MARSRSAARARDARRAADHHAAPSTPPVQRRLASVPWVAVAISAAVLVTAAFAVDPIRDAATLGPVGEATFTVPAAYLVTAPVSSSLDTLTLLTVGQHIAIILWAIAIFAAVRIARARRVPGTTTARREALAAFAFLAVIFLVYAAATMAPRPMAQIATSDGTVLVADFHAHTKYSHDGRTGWTEDDVRAWYRGAGFDVAYITDHKTYEGAERGIASNAGQAGEGTMLLQGLEAFYKGEHVNILSAGRRYKGLTDASLTDVDRDALTLSSMLAATSPALIETVPADLGKVASIAATDTSAGVVAIEMVDGSPRGLSQTRRDRARIVHLADSLNLALVTGSDNHGWGRAAPGWTLMRVGGWRGMTSDSLARRIEEILRVGRRQATKTVERRVAGGTTALSLLFAAPLVTWRMFTTLSPDERVSWLIWVWALVLIGRGIRRFRVRPSTAA